MSDARGMPAGGSGTAPDSADSPGALIRAAREKQGLHIAALAAAIKVSPRKLDALEHDRWHELPDAAFVRALAQTVCRSLKIDPRPVLERLPPADANSLESVTGTLNMPFQDRQPQGLFEVSAGAIKPLFWASGLLALAAAVVYFMPAAWLGGAGSDAANGSAATTGDTLLPPLNQPLSPAGVSPGADAAASAAAVASAPQAGADAEAAVVRTTAEPGSLTGSPAVETTPVPLDSPTATAVFDGPVQLRASQDSWVEARDGGGRLLLSRVVPAGERVGLDGALPMSIVIGNARATELVFRGRPVDLAPLTRNNVARVELR